MSHDHLVRRKPSWTIITYYVNYIEAILAFSKWLTHDFGQKSFVFGQNGP